MPVRTIRNKNVIENYFRKNTDLHLYSIGDLDDFFFVHTKWFAMMNGGAADHIALLYTAPDPPTFLAINETETEGFIAFVKEIKDKLPEKIYCHLSEGIIDAFGKNSILKTGGSHYKMSLRQKDMLIENSSKNIRRLGADDIDKIKGLYEKSYPDNFFDRRMLETGKYFGYFDDINLVGISGIHVYSEKYRVAALGNITVAHEFRGKSICKYLTSTLCLDLLKSVENIGLNVSIENFSAVSSYKKIGFEITGVYEEYLLKNK